VPVPPVNSSLPVPLEIVPAPELKAVPEALIVRVYVENENVPVYPEVNWMLCTSLAWLRLIASAVALIRATSASVGVLLFDQFSFWLYKLLFLSPSHVRVTASRRQTEHRNRMQIPAYNLSVLL